MSRYGDQHDNNLSNLVCLGDDGKDDKNVLQFKDVIENGETRLSRVTEKEHHLTFTNENSFKNGSYLSHKNLPSKGATGLLQSEVVYNVLKEYDNTNVNTGFKTGVVACLEKKLERKIHLIGCTLHHNELPFRKVFKIVDGSSKCPNKFSGPIGKQVSIDFHLNPQVKFTKIYTPVEILNIPIEVVNDLSHYQRLLFEYCLGISKGFVNPIFCRRKIGPLNNARWLTLAIRIMALYTRTEAPSLEHVRLVNFIVQVYAYIWFLIKRSSKFMDSPSIFFKMTEQIRKQDEEIQNICFKNLKKNSYCLLPENFLYCMLRDEDSNIREQALLVIKKLRTSKDKECRVTNIANVDINFQATSWTELIDFKKSSEPASTIWLKDDQIDALIATKEVPNLPEFPSRAQSIERAVKLVTEASHQVYGREARHKYILTKLKSREIRPHFETKNDFVVF
ncbi:uncharacterized protein LOC136080671 [Hydra vulgaris]|uniref:Uncharacterized protein LOC136080671 n=1 Tax=Hydra vulgaris TaxID=6087 RepID=A0ABM4BWV5_HYDVU